MEHWFKVIIRTGQRQWALLNGAWLFYTCLPLPRRWPVQFEHIARMAPIVGLGLGGFQAAIDGGLGLGMPLLLRSVVVVLAGIWLTGGLHLDGAMDTADGLAVQDDQRRLQVMTDSNAGAFGVMVAIAILFLKVAALTSISHMRWFALIAAAAWGRWGQQWAIGNYTYLKPQGKGAFHKQAIPSPWYTLPCVLVLGGLTLVGVGLRWVSWQYGVVAAAVGIGSSVLVASWLNHRLGGHTGDTYGAVVEWVEVAVLVGLAYVS